MVVWGGGGWLWVCLDEWVSGWLSVVVDGCVWVWMYGWEVEKTVGLGVGGLRLGSGLGCNRSWVTWMG